MSDQQRRKGKEAVVIAWVNGQWLDTDARQAKLDELTETIEYIAQEFPNVDDMPDEIAIDFAELLDERDRLRRIHRAESDLLYFAYEYFGDDLNPDNDGNWIPKYGDNTANVVSHAPDFHAEICEIGRASCRERGETKRVAEEEEEEDRQTVH